MDVEKIRVAAVQFNSKIGDKERNIAKAVELLEKVGREKVDVSAVPDYFSTGNVITKENIKNWAEPIPGPTTDRLADVAREFNMCIVGGGIVENEGGKFYCTSPLLDRKGTLIGKYRKVNFWAGPPMDEAGSGLTAGTDYPVFKIEGTTIGMLLQVDIDFPEPARILGLKGAEIFFWMTSVDYAWIDVCRFLAKAYAFNNLAYIVTVNTTGMQEGLGYFGESTIVNPLGEVISSAGTSYGTYGLFPEGMAIAEVDLGLVRGLRAQLRPFERIKRAPLSLLTEKKEA